MVLGLFPGSTVIVKPNSPCGVRPVDLPSAPMTIEKSGIPSGWNGFPAASPATVFHFPCNASSSFPNVVGRPQAQEVASTIQDAR